MRDKLRNLRKAAELKTIQIPTLDDDRVSIPFSIDVKGRKDPLEFRVPRRDFQPAEDIKLLQWLMSELDVDRDKLRELVDPDEPAAVEKACFLLALKPHVTAAQFKVLQRCTFGQLRFINDHWNAQSRVTLGEY